MCDPSGFVFELIAAPRPEAGRGSEASIIMGDEVKFAPGQTLAVRFPVECHIRMVRAGKVVEERRGQNLGFEIEMPGVYRVEGWLDVGGERRPWIYSNPIYVR